MEIKNLSETAGCVCLVTQNPIVTKLLALGFNLPDSGKRHLMLRTDWLQQLKLGREEEIGFFGCFQDAGSNGRNC